MVAVDSPASGQRRFNTFSETPTMAMQSSKIQTGTSGRLDFDTDVALAAQKAGDGFECDESRSPKLPREWRKTDPVSRMGRCRDFAAWLDRLLRKVLSFFSRIPDARGGGRTVTDFYRLFMVPGMAHCGGGIGPNSFGNGGNRFNGDPDRDLITALERWVEKGVAPERFIGTGTVAGDASKPLTRPLCAFPQVARYPVRATPIWRQASVRGAAAVGRPRIIRSPDPTAAWRWAGGRNASCRGSSGRLIRARAAR